MCERNPGPGPGRDAGIDPDSYSTRDGGSATSSSRRGGRGSFANEGRNRRSNSASYSLARSTSATAHHNESNVSFGGGHSLQSNHGLVVQIQWRE